MSVRERAAKALYERWRATDRELAVEWGEAGDRLRGVFLAKVDVVMGVISSEHE